MAKLVGRGTSNLPTGLELVHKTPSLGLTRGLDDDIVLYCSRVGDNVFPVKGDHLFFFKTKHPLRMFRWGSDDTTDTGFNIGDMNEFVDMIKSSVQKGFITEYLAAALLHLLDTEDEQAFGRKGKWVLHHYYDSKFAEYAKEVLLKNGYHGWVRDFRGLTEYLFLLPKSDLEPIEPPKSGKGQPHHMSRGDEYHKGCNRVY